MRPTTTAPQGVNDEGAGPLLLPAARCLTKDQAAAYLGIGVTLMTIGALLTIS